MRGTGYAVRVGMQGESGGNVNEGRGLILGDGCRSYPISTAPALASRVFASHVPGVADSLATRCLPRTAAAPPEERGSWFKGTPSGHDTHMIIHGPYTYDHGVP